ncbi:hypothetical protein ACFCX4_06395 [Kitasatospora sp. NPDC056327]|uniref:hypothetical protein n=1 Tax=Kitasatospora sp. NPDC056327 TaxID=3345785 RepID=UPI0035DD1EBF
MIEAISRITSLPPRALAALMTAVPVILIVTVNLPAALLWSFRPGPNTRSNELLGSVTAWTHALNPAAPSPDPAPDATG